MKNSKPLFITFEGIDGSGKTTIINLLKKEYGSKFYFTREPGGSPIANQIRKVVLDNKNVEMCSETEALLYAASRFQHLNEIIIPKLKSNINIISDRYVDSSIAYQGISRNLGENFIVKINPRLIPDKTFLFILDIDKLEKRINNRDDNKIDRLDKEDKNFYIKVQNSYLELAKKNPNRFIIINANSSISNVYNDVSKELKKVCDF